MKKKLLAFVALAVAIALAAVAGIYADTTVKSKSDSGKIRALKLEFSNTGSDESYNAILAQYAKEKNVEGALDFIDMTSEADLRAERFAKIYDRNSDSPIKSGNTMSNIQNGGTVAFSGDKIFFVSKQGAGALVKNENGVNTTLVEGAVTSLNVVDEWIYYSDKSDYCVYKIRQDGSGKKRVGSFLTTQFYIIGDKMYFVNYSDEGHIYSADISGRNVKKLSDRPVQRMSIYGTSIYLSDNSEGGAVYAIPIRGGSETPFFEFGADYIVGYRDGIIFRSDAIADEENSYLTLCKMESNAEAYEVLYDSRVGYTNMSGEDIIFVDFEDDGAIMRTRSDFTGLQKITNDEASALMLDGDFIYYYNEDDANKLYRINKDGEMRECLE